MMQLNQPNIMTMYEMSTDDKLNPYYLVFEYMEHGNLEMYTARLAGISLISVLEIHQDWDKT